MAKSSGFYDFFSLEMTDSLVGVVDVLGFKKLVYDPSRNEQTELIVNLFPDIIKSNKSYFPHIKFQFFSDSLVITCPAEKAKGVQYFQSLAHALCDFQYELALSRIWVRGVIIVGKCFHDPERSVIVGPAYIQAANREKGLSHPRIAIDSSVWEYYGLDKQSFIHQVNKYPEIIYPGNLLAEDKVWHTYLDFVRRGLISPQYYFDWLAMEIDKQLLNFYLKQWHPSYESDSPFLNFLGRLLKRGEDAERLIEKIKEDFAETKSARHLIKHLWTKQYITRLTSELEASERKETLLNGLGKL